MRAAVDRKTLDAARQRDRALHDSAGELGGHDLGRALIEYAMIKRFKPNADFLVLHDGLLHNLGNDAGADGSAAFADGEAQTLFHGDRGDQRRFDRHVIARHDHLNALGQG